MIVLRKNSLNNILMDFGAITRLNYALILFGLEISANIGLDDRLLNNSAIWFTSTILEVYTVFTNPLNSHQNYLLILLPIVPIVWY